jgi:hypothetical protein
VFSTDERGRSAEALEFASLQPANTRILHNGLVYYENALAQGLTVAQVANGFAASPEFQATYAQLSDAAT